MSTKEEEIQKIQRIQENTIDKYKKYLDRIKINEVSGQNIQDELKKLIFGEFDDNNNKFKQILENINTHIKLIVFDSLQKEKCSLIDKKRLWVDCMDKCQIELSRYLNLEINSIAYILRIITESYINMKPKSEQSPISFSFPEDFVNKNSKWDKIKNILNLHIDDQNQSRLIMGFGPSASGKTHCAKSIIKMLSLADKNFPKTFMTIDGGIFREQSILYEYIINLIKYYKLGGFNNMKLSGVSINKKSLFDSSKIKTILYDFLMTHKNKNQNNHISLYIPETLGKCFLEKNCKKEYNKYFKICDQQNWIGLYIYQHKHNYECDFKGKYACNGTTISGKTREIDEGKKFSNNAYKNSEIFGIKEILSAPYSFKIHNTGRKEGISIIEDYTNYTNYTDKKKLEIGVNIEIDNEPDPTRKNIFKLYLYKFISDDISLTNFRYVSMSNSGICKINNNYDDDNDNDDNDNDNDGDNDGPVINCDIVGESLAGGYKKKYLKYKNKYIKLKYNN
jgi:hypothetical protein